jgi:hypothetical protein
MKRNWLIGATFVSTLAALAVAQHLLEESAAAQTRGGGRWARRRAAP